MAPTDNSLSAEAATNFELKCSVTANNLYPVHKYVSKRTGLSVVVAEVEGPIVDGYFCLATEAHDDDGLPHTLEHLVFMGSEKYPYKGVLDLLANRCFASGTNAWTDVDHTCYSMTTAGSEGFLTLMPIYLDHILYPTLTDASFTTEVHHVNGEGGDGGVVYAEIQAVENTGERLLNRELMRALYPGKCGYKSQTGGVMENLRNSTTNEKVRKYHQEFYRPENLCIIVVGHIKPNEVLNALSAFEEKIVSKGPRGDFVRPWQFPIEPLPNKCLTLDVLYPNDEEKYGMVYIGYRGPSAVKDHYELTAWSVLLKYLTDTSVSLFCKEFVDIPDPYCSKVSFSICENPSSAIVLTFDNVPNDKLHQLKSKYDSLIKSMLEGNIQFLDMVRLKTVINRYRLEVLSSFENSPHESIVYTVIPHMLYGNEPQDLDIRLNQVREIEKLTSEPFEFWIRLFSPVFAESGHVYVTGIPSIGEQKRLSRLETERIAEKVKQLGPSGLAAKEQELASAMAINEISPPEEVLKSLPFMSTDSISFHSLSSTTSDSEQQDPRFPLNEVPVYMHLDHLQTNFIYTIALMDSSTVDAELRLYIPLLLELVQESPIRRGDTIVPYQQVIAELECDTITTSLRVGLDSGSRFQAGPFSSTISFLLQVEPQKYVEGIKWIRDLLYNTVLTEERVKVLATKIKNNVAEVKRKGDDMTYDLMRGLLYKKNCNHYAVVALRQYKFLSSVLSKLENKETAAEVLNDLEKLRAILTSPSNLAIHLSLNLDILSSLYQNPASHWMNNLLPEEQREKASKKRLSPVADWELLEEKSTDQSCIAGIGSVESVYFCQTINGIKDYSHSDLPKILVFFQYITQMEGPMWRQIRGQGLAYSYSIITRPNEAKLFLYFYRATNITAAYKEARNVLESRLGDAEWDETLFESAKSSLIFEIVNREKCIGDVVAQSLLSYFKHVGHDYNSKLVKQIASVTTDDMKDIGVKYVSPLLDGKAPMTTVICHPSKVEEIANGLGTFGLKFKTYASLDESFLSDI